MASEKNLQAYREEIQEAFDRLLHELRAERAPGPKVLGALASLQAAIEPLVSASADDDDPVGTKEYKTIRARDRAGAHPQRSQAGENHGKGAAPRGYRFEGGLLTDLNWPTGSEHSADIAAALLVTLAGAFRVPENRQGALADTRSLGSVVRALLPVATPHVEKIATHAGGLEAAYEALHGHRYGDHQWWEEPLTSHLEMNARRILEREHREEQERKAGRVLRRRVARGRPPPRRTKAEHVELVGDRLKPDLTPTGALDGPASGSQILEVLTFVSGDRTLPVELTAEAIDDMIARTGVGENRGGGRPRKGTGKAKKPARTVVAEFKASLK